MNGYPCTEPCKRIRVHADATPQAHADTESLGIYDGLP